MQNELSRILLKTSAGLYLQGIDKWTWDPAQAFDFKHPERALKFVGIWGLKNVMLAFALCDRNKITGTPLERGSAGHAALRVNARC